MNIVWLKRDLRTTCHEAFNRASTSDFICIYIFEPSLSYNYDFDIRHWRFVWQSLKDMEKKGLRILKFYGEATDVFEYLNNEYENLTIFSHMEVGNDLTYKRDVRQGSYFKKHDIDWHEFRNFAVIRGLKSRISWDKFWIKFMRAEIGSNLNFENCSSRESIDERFSLPSELVECLDEINSNQLRGGESLAQNLLNLFLSEKVSGYWSNLSYPEKSRYTSSQLSAHIAWGTISIRDIYQSCARAREGISSKKSLDQYMARLKWHCHFIQKLESEPSIEFTNVNNAFDHIRKKKNKEYIKAWKEGMTGYPLVDAGMRCVEQTGYLNFRLRATVTSFLTHLLWQPWQAGTGHLARMFLDYEPGIHFSQFQMQAGTTGINTIRIYNPIKQSLEKDKNAEFIKRWVPELRGLPIEFIHEPWKMTEMDQMMYEFKLGDNYPQPIVEFNKAYKFAQNGLWEIKKSSETRENNKGILKRHARKQNTRRPKK